MGAALLTTLPPRRITLHRQRIMRHPQRIMRHPRHTMWSLCRCESLSGTLSARCLPPLVRKTPPRQSRRRVQRPGPLQTATISSKSKASPVSAAAPPVQFPIAQRVPGKSGLVMSPYDPEARYVDVSGYASGSKVKDPWTEKIFIVP
jgi:hypothetical protein